MEDYRLLNNDVGDIVGTVMAERLTHLKKTQAGHWCAEGWRLKDWRIFGLLGASKMRKFFSHESAMAHDCILTI